MKNQNADELLESIFYYMNQLFEKRDFTSTIEILTNLGRTLVQSDRASFWFWDRKSHQYWTLAAVGNERIVVPENTGIVGVTMQENRPVVLNEPYEDSRFNPAVDMETGYRTKSILCIPVTSEHGEMLGAYQALNKQGEDGDCAFDEKDVKRLSLVAVFGAKTLESYLLHNKAFFDQLTGLKNRSGLYEAFHTRILSGQKKTYSIVMGDIDYFKKVNDTYGHECGDKILILVADTIRSHMRPEDCICRWGGEEILLLINGTETVATALAEKIRASIEQACVTEEGTKVSVTMTFGVASYIPGFKINKLIQLADNNLYIGKNNGKNQVVS